MSDIQRIGGRYDLLERVGAGGMGVVYRARDTEIGADVALKVIRTDQPDLATRFEREVRLLGELSHAAIVSYLDSGVTERGRPYLVMEWIEGPTLRERLERAPLNAAESVRLIMRISEALALAHDSGVLHRDVKPSNIILGGGDIDRAVLIDFGLARRTDRSDGLTRTGVALGTPGYMAPEQALGRRDLDARTDLFAIGAVLYECLTGRPAFVGAHRTAVLAKVVMCEPVAVADLAQVPAQLAAIVDSLLAKKAADRVKDCASLVATLSSLAALPQSRPQHAREAAPPASSAAGSSPTAADSAVSVAAVVAMPAAPGEPIAGLPAARQVFELADGAVVLVTEPSDTAAAEAVKWALALKDGNPSLSLAVVSDAATAGGAIGADALDRATGGLLGGSIEEAFADVAGDIVVDERTAAALPDPFSTTVVGKRLVVRRG